MRGHQFQDKLYKDFKEYLDKVISDEDFVTHLLQQTTIEKIQKKQILYPNQTEGSFVYFLYTGMIWTFYIVDGKSEKKLTDYLFYTMGDLICPEYTLSENSDSIHRIYQAIEDSVLLKISIADWQKLLGENKQLLDYYTQTVMDELNWHKQIREMRSLNVTERYQWLKKCYPALSNLKKCYLMPLLDISSTSYKNIENKRKMEEYRGNYD